MIAALLRILGLHQEPRPDYQSTGGHMGRFVLNLAVLVWVLSMVILFIRFFMVGR